MSSLGIPVIGIIGGIGAGKSAVGHELSKHFKVYLLDADTAGHRVLENEQVKQLLVEEFGPQVLNSQGKVIRSEIAKLVFGQTPQHREAKQFLDALMHPAIRTQLEQELVNAIEAGMELVVLDAALLLEAGWAKLCDAIIFLDTPEAVRIERVQQRGWSADDLKNREASQLPLAEKRARADYILSNSAPLTEVGQQLADYIRRTFFKVVSLSADK